MDVRKCHILVLQAYPKYNDNYKYILSVIHVFSKFLFLIPVKTKSRPTVATAFRSLFYDDSKKNSRRPLWVRTDKGKEFLNKYLEDILGEEGIEFQV